jgi:type IV pilus assembly protein PilO
MNQLRRFFTLLNLHLAVVVALAAGVLFLAIKAMVAVHEAGAMESASFEQQQMRYAQLQAQMAHLQGLPQKVDQARDDAARFYEKRLAPNYSTIAEELGTIEVKNQVRLMGAHYIAKPAIDGLHEVDIDANLSGDYSPLMHFINDLERDKNHVFFIIDGLTLTGQQGGLVNLRLRMTTYLQAGATDLPPNSGSEAGTATGAGTEPVSEANPATGAPAQEVQ